MEKNYTANTPNLLLPGILIGITAIIMIYVLLFVQ